MERIRKIKKEDRRTAKEYIEKAFVHEKLVEAYERGAQIADMAEVLHAVVDLSESFEKWRATVSFGARANWCDMALRDCFIAGANSIEEVIQS